MFNSRCRSTNSLIAVRKYGPILRGELDCDDILIIRSNPQGHLFETTQLAPGALDTTSPAQRCLGIHQLDLEQIGQQSPSLGCQGTSQKRAHVRALSSALALVGGDDKDVAADYVRGDDYFGSVESPFAPSSGLATAMMLPSTSVRITSAELPTAATPPFDDDESTTRAPPGRTVLSDLVVTSKLKMGLLNRP